MVGASLEVMDRDARRMRGERPFVFANLKDNLGLDAIAAFIERTGGLSARASGALTVAQSQSLRDEDLIAAAGFRDVERLVGRLLQRGEIARLLAGKRDADADG